MDLQNKLRFLRQSQALWAHNLWELWCAGFRHSAGLSRQSDSWWRNLSTEGAWRCAWCTGCSRSCCVLVVPIMPCSCVVVEGRVTEKDDVLVVNGRWDSNKGWDMCGPDDRFFSGAQRCYAILKPCACDAFRDCEQTVLRCMCSVYGCTVHTHRRFLEFQESGSPELHRWYSESRKQDIQSLQVSVLWVVEFWECWKDKRPYTSMRILQTQNFCSESCVLWISPYFKKKFRKGVEQRNTKERQFTRTLWSLLQGLNWHLETACGKTFRTSNPCPRLQFTKVCQLEQTQNPDLLQQLLEEQLLDQSLKFTSYKHLAPMDLKSKVNLQII